MYPLPSQLPRVDVGVEQGEWAVDTGQVHLLP